MITYFGNIKNFWSGSMNSRKFFNFKMTEIIMKKIVFFNIVDRFFNRLWKYMKDDIKNILYYTVLSWISIWLVSNTQYWILIVFYSLIHTDEWKHSNILLFLYLNYLDIQILYYFSFLHPRIQTLTIYLSELWVIPRLAAWVLPTAMAFGLFMYLRYLWDNVCSNLPKKVKKPYWRWENEITCLKV